MVANLAWRMTSLTPYLGGDGPGSWLVLPVLLAGTWLMLLGLLIWRLRTPWRWSVRPGAAAGQARRPAPTAR